ncbi:hypothetical protein RFI_38824, partial [Reticulomyxa filosa]
MGACVSVANVEKGSSPPSPSLDNETEDVPNRGVVTRKGPPPTVQASEEEDSSSDEKVYANANVLEINEDIIHNKLFLEKTSDDNIFVMFVKPDLRLEWTKMLTLKPIHLTFVEHWQLPKAHFSSFLLLLIFFFYKKKKGGENCKFKKIENKIYIYIYIKRKGTNLKNGFKRGVWTTYWNMGQRITRSWNSDCRWSMTDIPKDMAGLMPTSMQMAVAIIAMTTSMAISKL